MAEGRRRWSAGVDFGHGAWPGRYNGVGRVRRTLAGNPFPVPLTDRGRELLPQLAVTR